MPPPSPLIPPLACSSPSTSSSTHLSDRLKSLESGPFVDAVHGLELWEDGKAATGASDATLLAAAIWLSSEGQRANHAGGN